MAKEDFKLEQTKSKIKLEGIVSRLDSDKAYSFGNVKEGKNQGKAYRSLRFGVKTSDVNEIQVELFGMEQDQVYAYNRKKKSGEWFDFEKRDRLPDGYDLMGVRVALEKDSKGKVVSKNLHSYDAVEEIFNSLEDGESIYVSGHLEFSTYQKEDGEEVLQRKYIIDSIGRTKKEIDFEADDFEEVNDFEQDIVIVDVMAVKEEKKYYITGRTIKYGDKWQDADFVIDVSQDEDAIKLAKIFKSLKFGDFVTVFGKAFNKVVLIETEDKEKPKVDKNNPFASFDKKKPKSLEKSFIKDFISELRIEGVVIESFAKGKYTEDDFVEQEVVKNDKPKGDNPFANTDNGDEDSSDDDGDLW